MRIGRTFVPSVELRRMFKGWARAAGFLSIVMASRAVFKNIWWRVIAYRASRYSLRSILSLGTLQFAKLVLGAPGGFRIQSCRLYRAG